MASCIFCSIVEGRIPAYKVYEDRYCVAIMDRYPSGKGHVLILPKRHVEDIYGLDQEEAGQILLIAQMIAAKMRDVLGMSGLNLLQNNGKAAGQVIDHFHLHLIPRYENDGIQISPKPTDPPLEELERIAGLLKIG